jgi:hypothetical protein
MEHRLIKKIDEYEFELLYKMIDTSYIYIKIKNISRQIDFIVYASNSQGNIYRFCSRTASDSTHLFKGNYDYVTETFIHMELQKFISENLDKLAEVKLDRKTLEKICPVTTDNCYLNYDRTFISYKDYIDRRFINFDFSDDPFLCIINKLRCGNGFIRIYYIIENIIKIYDIYGYLSFKSISKNFDKLITNILLIFGKGNSGPNRIELNEIFLELVARGHSGLTDENKHKLIKFYLEFISFYMNTNYEIKFQTKTYLYTTGKFIMKAEPSIKLNFDFYSVVIQNKDNKLEYTIIYAIYDYSNSVIPESNGRYTIVLNMIPHQDDGNKINSLGLYRKFITIGIYLCKPFDYLEQVKTLVPGLPSQQYYLFIGDLYHNLFPVKQILDLEINKKLENQSSIKIEQIKKEIEIIKFNSDKLSNRLKMYAELFELNNSLIQLINDNLDDVTGEVKQKCLQIRDVTITKNINIKIEQQQINNKLLEYQRIYRTLT